MKRLISLLAILCIVIVPVYCKAAFYDIEYGPEDSKGIAGYTEEQAQEETKKYEKNKKEEKSDNFVGKSTNNYLKSITVTGGIISPEFNRQYVDYDVKINHNTAKINVSAEAEDEKATVEGTGEFEVNEELTRLIITCTSESGKVQFYNLYFSKEAKEEVIEKLEEFYQDYNDESINKNIIFTKRNILISLFIVIGLIIITKLCTKNKHKKHTNKGRHSR